MDTRYIIAVAGPTGSGKTAMALALADKLVDAATIHFDHYESLTGEPLQFLQAWISDQTREISG